MQLLVRIVTRADNGDTPVDDLLVRDSDIPADGIFRRISALSMQETALVGVNVKVDCTNETITPNCSVPVFTTTEEVTTQASTEPGTTPEGEGTSTEDTATSTEDTTPTQNEASTEEANTEGNTPSKTA